MVEKTLSPSEDPEGFAAAIGRFEEAFNTGDPRRAAREIYTSDARILPAGAPMITGRENIARFWERAAQQMRLERVKLKTVELELHGDWAHEIGQTTLSLAGGQEAASKYVVVWKLEKGAWRWFIDIWNMDA